MHPKLIKAAQEVEAAETEYGSRIEPGIRTLVIALRAHGFPTSGSCEGHPESGKLYPWVLFWNRTINGVLVPSIPNEQPDFAAWADTTFDQIQKLKSLLERFRISKQGSGIKYEGHELRLKYSDPARITPFDMYRLECRASKVLDLLPPEVTEGKERAILVRNQQEVLDFAEFLVRALESE